jgi:hypothetical protein
LKIEMPRKSSDDYGADRSLRRIFGKDRTMKAKLIGLAALLVGLVATTASAATKAGAGTGGCPFCK